MEKKQQGYGEKHFIESVGLLFEESGHPRMAGRILGCLLISDPPYQSTTELGEMVQASKGSLSTMTRFLLQMGLIERVGLPGQRGDFFQIKASALTSLVRHSINEFSALRQLTERGLELMKKRDSEIKKRLQEARDLFSFLEREYPLLIERWEKEHKRVSK